MAAAPPVAKVSVWHSRDLQKLRPASLESLGHFGNHRANFIRRDRTGEAEVHVRTADVFVIQTGQATLVTGGRIPNAKSSTKTEIRGASIEGGQSQVLVPGDIVQIPAGLPHQFVLARGAEVTYFALKIDGK
ncbi:MAG: hypothetical protein SGI92_05725 [Bryobacteraceae bacterium]|nr:hypothetical protein [Bryobacteraceae bacterium]